MLIDATGSRLIIVRPDFQRPLFLSGGPAVDDTLLLTTAGTCRPDGMAIVIVRSNTATEGFAMMPTALEERHNHEDKLQRSS
jgi:hypothetical protein